MRSVVALVEARPETIAEDYRRLLDLAGLEGLAESSGPAVLAAQAAPDGWFPGAVSPPWQLAGVLERLRKTSDRPAPPVVAAVNPQGDRCPDAGWGWDGVMAAGGAVPATDAFWERRPWRAAVHRPSLGAALPRGCEVPAGLDKGPLVLLPVPSLNPAWPLAGAVRLLVSLLLGRLTRPRRLPVEEIRAEAVAQSLEVLAGRDIPLATVMDGTIWEIGPGHRGRGPVTRNILLAGTDPVAVDTVATQLAGADPARVPWLRMGAEWKLGAARPADIRLVGQVDLMDRPFGHPDAPTRPAGLHLPPLADLSWRIMGRPTILRRHGATPWGRLYEDYRLGANPGDSR